MSGGGKASAPNYNLAQGSVNYSPTAYTQTPDYTNAINSLQGYMNTSNANTGQLANTLQNYQNNVLSPGYSALSPSQMSTEVSNAQQLLQPEFQQNQSQLANHLANSGLSGSGASGMDWSQLGQQEDQALAGIYNNVYNQNLGATQQNIGNGLNATGTLNNLYQEPVANQTEMTNIYGNNQNAENTWNQWNANNQLGSQEANVNSYNNWYNAQTQQANQQNNAKGSLVGNLGSAAIGQIPTSKGGGGGTQDYNYYYDPTTGQHGS